MGRRYGILITLLLVGLPLLAVAEYRGDYVDALDAMERQDWAQAELHLQHAIVAQPRSAAQIRLRGMRFAPYLPWLHLGVVRQARSDCEGAVAAWEQAIEQGVARHDPSFEQLRAGMGACGAEIPPAGDYSSRTATSTFRDVENPSYKRHYRAALDHLAAREPELAEQALLDALAENPTPQARIRLYGMRFIPYLPYYQLAEARLLRGDCPGAEAAWVQARQAGVAPADPETAGFKILLEFCPDGPA